MVVNDFDLSGVRSGPHETNAVTVVHSDWMLPNAIFRKRFKWGPGTGKVPQFSGRVEHHQLTEGNAVDAVEFPAALFVEDFLGFGAAERNDHKIIV
jgi:hypothetical protein